MKSSSLPNVRLVRCPRCMLVLPEPTNVPFYRCGGCDTTLQAKHYNKANERRNSEGSDSVQNNEVEYGAKSGEPSSSNPSLFTDPNEGINQSNAEHGNFEQPGVSNSSGEASSTSESKQQPPSSSAQHFLERKEETEENFEVTNTLREDPSMNESSSPSDELPSTLLPETGEVEGEVEQRGDSIASSSNESVEQLVSLVSENGEVRQDEIVAENQLETAYSHSETVSSEPTTARTDEEADERNQDVSINCRLEQSGVATFLSEGLLSNEPSHHWTNNSSQVAAEEGQVEENSTEVKEQLKVSDSSGEPILTYEPTAGGDELSSQLGSPNEEVMMTEKRFVSNPRERQPVSEVNRECEVSSTNEPVSILKRNDSSSQFLTANEEGEGDNVVLICRRDADVYSNTETSSNKSTFQENRDLSQLVTQSQDMDEGSIQNELGISNESEIVLPEAEKTSGSILQFKSVEADDGPSDGSNSVPALKPTKEAEVLSVVDRSQKTTETNLTEKIKEEKATETTEVVGARFEAGTSYRDLPKCPTRSSAYDGSVSSYDGNDDQVKTEKFAAEDRRPYRPGRSTTAGGSAFQSKLDNLQAMPEERNSPVMLTEIKMPEVPSDAPYRRKGRRPWTQEFPTYRRRSPERRRYGSSGHLVHKEYYNHPIYHPPYQYRDVESRFTRQSDVDGRMISEAVWMGEEFHMYPYSKSSGEIYTHPSHQMYYQGTRREYQPPVHSIARVPYSGERVGSSGYMRWPSHLPPPGVSYGRGLYGSREPFDSYAASPQVFSDSDYYSEDQRHRNQRTRRNSQPVQHFQPIGGAAPFITCYHCLELLQLPSDFLVFKGIKIQRVKCSACSKILKFTLEKGRHLVRHVPKQPMAAGADKLLKSASTSQAYHDYEALHRRTASAQVSIRSSSHALERPRSSKHFQDKGKSVMVEMHKHSSNAQGGSSPDIPRNAKVTWKLPDRSSSPLHRLMGYSSPSAVLYGYGSDELETEDYSRKGNDFIRRSDI